MMAMGEGNEQRCSNVNSDHSGGGVGGIVGTYCVADCSNVTGESGFERLSNQVMKLHGSSIVRRHLEDVFDESHDQV